MCKFVQKTKGAISLFLALLLLPLMSVASIFVDMSRLNLAQSMAASAGDLTLNTALTNYDAELKTLYGLFATAQNMDEMMEGLEDYYRQSIEAAGVDGYYAEDFARKLVNSIKAETGTDDLMNIQLGGFDVEVPDGAHLGNPAILKNQIVEFMKYRAPVNLGMGFIDALKSMKTLSKQMDVVEKKNAYYAEHQTMLGHVEAAWKPLQNYQYKDSSSNTGFPTGSYITDKATTLAGTVDGMKQAVSDTVKYLYDIDNFVRIEHKISLEYKCPECGEDSKKGKKTCDSCDATWDLDTGNYVWKAKWNNKTNTLTSTYTKDKPATLKDVAKAYKNVRQQLDAISAMGTNTAVHKAYNNTSSDEAVQIYITCQLKANGNSYLQAVKDLVQRMVHLNSALLTCEDEALKTTKINASTYEIDTNGTIYLYSDGKKQLTSHMKTDGNDYIQIFNTAVNKSNGYVDALNKNESCFIPKTIKRVNTSIQNAQKAASEFYNFIDGKINNLTSAIEHLSQARTMLSSGGSCTTTKNSWSSSAQGLGDDTMGQRDQDEIKDLEKIIDYDKVNKLITRLTAAKTALTKVRDEIAKYSICGKAFKDIPANPTFKNLVSIIKADKSGKNFNGRITGTTVTSNRSFDEIIGEIKGTVKTGNVPTTWNSGEGPNLGPDFPALFSWMYNNYYDPNLFNDGETTTKTNSADDDLDKATGNIESAKATGHKTASEVSSSSGTKVSDRNMSQFKDVLPSTTWKGDKKEFAKGEFSEDGSAEGMMSNKANDNFLKTIMDLAVDMGRDLRDNLYVSEYIMTMFSYATMEAEIWDQTNTDANFPAGGFFEEVNGAWEANAKYASFAAEMETLTKVPFDPDLNYLYGEEVEYILYGEAGATGVYATIFALRFGLNTVYAFMDAEINNVTLSAATALFGTPPLTPLIPVAKIAMTIALALAESGWDLNELSKGKAIPLMKNKDTWVMSPSGIAKEVKDEAMTIAKEAANKAVDKGYEVLNKALSATSEELDAIIASGEEGIGQLADAALASATSSLENYANLALQKAVELCNQVNQEFMMNTMPDADSSINFPGDITEKANAVRARLDAWIGTQTGDTAVVKEVKQIAVNYLKGSGQIEALFTAIETQATSGEPTDYLNGKLKAISDEINIMIEDATTKAGSALKDMKDSMVSELTAAAKEGADKLKQTLSNKLDDCFDQVPTSNSAPNGAASGVVSSLLSWRYSDYLRLFVVVGLFANEELMLLRIADLIERNMQHKNNEEVLVTTTKTVTKSRFFGLIKYKKEETVTSRSDSAFTLSKSYTYLKLKAYIQVKPLFMTLPFMAETVENELTGTNWYEFTSTSIMGY